MKRKSGKRRGPQPRPLKTPPGIKKMTMKKSPSRNRHVKAVRRAIGER